MSGGAGTEAKGRAALEEGAAGAAPPNIALMRALMEASSVEAFDRVLVQVSAGQAEGSPEAVRMAEIARLWRTHPEAWALVHRVLATADHSEPSRPDADSVVEHWTGVFDRLGATAPDAGVALYALGDPELLARATDEIVARMDQWDLLGPERDALEIGCGSGRFIQALAPRLRFITGLDISSAMVAEACRRCAGLANVRLEQTAGHDLAALADGAVDLVLAADVFPYLVQGGPALVAKHMREAARVLRPGGTLLVLNFSYRGDVARDRSEAVQAASRAGLECRRLAAGDFTLWDGATFHFTRP